MKTWISIAVIGVLSSVVQALPLAPAARGSDACALTAIPTYSSVPQADYTALITSKGEGIITGGPLSFGPALSGIMDMTGPDQEQIIAYMESRAYLERSWVGLSRHTHTFRPATPRGVQFKKANMIDLWPQNVWFVPAQWTESADFPLYQQAAVPEPATVVLLGAGALVVVLRRRK